MKTRTLRILIIFLTAGFFSCQDRDKNTSENVEIIPAEEKKDELREDDAPMERSRILARMREEGELSRFTEEMQKSGLEEEFEGKEGLYTIFAPSNAAYDRIPAKEMTPDSSLGTDNSKGDDLRYYMVEGEMTLDYLRQKINASNNNRFEFRTALGEKLWATEKGDKIILTDVLGNQATIVTSNMEDHFGVYHIIDNTLHAKK
ncbi:fasciclin domain-containing protein [Salinimicrobium xinjiangense]|uniref:fasciclin domain-containing protein n=1 Tax=Salinimicrobium xinjiangense TaxID=438596 RepID=UPI00041F11B1|nr:fasciclin domain-containing protein [Salinimicrobium xinjiangense]